MEAVNEEIKLPPGTCILESQVSGHSYDPKKNCPGILRAPNGCILKPGEKEVLRKREIDFYERIKSGEDPMFKELSKLTAKYYGTTELKVSDKSLEFLVLQDITEGLAEPCVMDIKMGKRTWDPLAGPEKRAKEDQKYSELKQTYSFCIPGFQVYDITTGNLKKFSKEYGKNLNATTVIDALKIFLNISPDHPPCRELIVKLLSSLWKILAFFRSQTKLQFFSSSLLIVYDAKRLRKFIQTGLTEECNSKSEIYTRGVAVPISSSSSDYSSGFNTPKSLSPLSSSPSFSQFIRSGKDNLEKTNTDAFFNGSLGRHLNNSHIKLCRTHSFDHDYDRDMIEMKEDYASLLEELTGKKRQDWVRVAMIDFTHVFPADKETIDINYLEGIENLIKILESFLV
ncbi:inositol polyphosphate multikinase [Chelonus insularis]|uniref:inositol polyphosphate multikinase n=1 Tax=Chelonus insularis TaxID=460826 RepID=UPI00158A58C0|nr:inositol polyphosphate multikinase [Chelonus insularis]XP_034948307.1 inositol polyphosphate multikinase [Chelonus insularis]